MLVLLVAAAKILAVKAGKSIHLAHLPCQPACLVSVLAARFLFVEVDFLQTNIP
jgi:hypothetical protein